MNENRKRNIKQMFSLKDMCICAIAISLVMLSFFSGGLYGIHCSLAAIIIGLCSLFAVRKNGNIIAEILLLCLIVLATVSSYASHTEKETVIFEFSKLIGYVTAFVFAIRYENKRDIMKIIILSSLVIAVLGILTYCNIIRIQESVIIHGGIPRMQSICKYANVTATVCAVGYILSIEYISERKIPHSIVSMILLVAMYLTVSKACILIFLALGTVYIHKNRKCADMFIYQNIVCIIMLIPVIYTAKKHLFAITILLIAACIAGGAHRFDMKQTAYKLWYLALIFAVCAAVIYVLKTSGLKENTMTKRFIYMIDALKLLRHHWFIGIGAGGWQQYQYLIQSENYDVAYIHNGWLEFLVEYGAFAFFLMCTTVMLAIKQIIADKKYTLLFAILIIAIHSLMDMDFGYGLIMIYFGLLCGAGYINDTKNRKTLYISLILCCIIISMYITAVSAIEHFAERDFSVNKKDRYRFYSSVLELLIPQGGRSNMILSELNNDNTEFYLKRWRENDPLSRQALSEYIEFTAGEASEEELMELFTQYIELAPLQEDTYMYLEHTAEMLCQKKIIFENERQMLFDLIDDERRKNEVTDRNKLLQEIAGGI